MQSADRVAVPFQIGLKPLDPSQWIDADAQLPDYLAEKERVITAHRSTVFAAEPETGAAQAELLALLVEYLPGRYPALYGKAGRSIDILPTGRSVSLDDDDPPLLRAARLVQDDLVLMRKDGAHWRLVAASLCFPSAWKLADKIGRPMHEVHGPVPGFGAETRNAGMIERMFDHLRPEAPGLRWNWSLFGDDRLHHPESSHASGPRFGGEAETAFLRVERQTLRRLPGSGDIVFGIRIYVDPLGALSRSPDGRRIAAAMIGQLGAMNAEQLEYKGLAADRDILIRRLTAIAG